MGSEKSESKGCTESAGSAGAVGKSGNPAYAEACERYAAWGVDTEEALRTLDEVSIALHCWQGDDVRGFEQSDAGLEGSGLMVTGQHPGRARTPEELRADLETAFALIPGGLRLNLHAIYGEFDGCKVDRDAIGVEHFIDWIGWARELGVALDFNCTCFAHPKAADGWTLSSRDEGKRAFWIEHVKRCRKIAAAMGLALGSPAIHNLWIPDGSKDLPADRWTPRRLLEESLDEVYKQEFAAEQLKDSLESKLFGIGSEAYVVGSHEFYLGYALTHKKMICLDTGHFHPTELVADKVSALLRFTPELLLHVSRGVRWDSDHVVVMGEELRQLTAEVVRGGVLDKVHFALDYFDATINRVGAWVIGARATFKGLLMALLEPRNRLERIESAGDQGSGFERLALFEEQGTLPFGAVWEEYCARYEVPIGAELIDAVERYGAKVAGER